MHIISEEKFIEKECNCNCNYVGLGAGSKKFLPGSAKSRGFKRGGSDLEIEGTNLCIEVTGPNIYYVKAYADLWIRPDKIKYAIDNIEKDCWVVHVLKNNFLLRTIHLNDDFKKDYNNDAFKEIHPPIRGTVETYIAIPANSNHVQDFTILIKAIQKNSKI